MRRFSKNKESGVVLLSCLIFLLILLSLLRFNLGSSQIQELKAGADYDQMTAREAAILTMREAEFDALQIPVAERATADKEAKAGEAAEYWADKANWQSRQGIFDGDDNSIKCQPSYTCINWLLTGKNAQTIQTENGKYFIERFMGDGATLDLDKGATLTKDRVNEDVVVLRVTALGFGRGRNGDVNRNSVMLQNTYILVPEK